MTAKNGKGEEKSSEWMDTVRTEIKGQTHQVLELGTRVSSPTAPPFKLAETREEKKFDRWLLPCLPKFHSIQTPNASLIFPSSPSPVCT